MTTIVTKAHVLKRAEDASVAYTQVSALEISTSDSDDLRFLLSCILNWQVLDSAYVLQRDTRIDSEAAHLARWQADNFSEKLIVGRKPPAGIRELASRLSISIPSVDEAIMREQIQLLRPPRPWRARSQTLG